MYSVLRTKLVKNSRAIDYSATPDPVQPCGPEKARHGIDWKKLKAWNFHPPLKEHVVEYLPFCPALEYSLVTLFYILLPVALSIIHSFSVLLELFAHLSSLGPPATGLDVSPLNSLPFLRISTISYFTVCT